MWLLLLIKLVLTPTPHVVEVEIVDFFDSEQKCIQKIKTIPKGVIPYTLSEWGVAKSDLPQLVEESFTKGRMDNNIVDLTKDQVLKILHFIK